MDGTTLVEYVGKSSILEIPEGVRAIDSGAFRDRKQLLEAVLLPESLRAIRPHTFAGCRKLRRILLPSGLLSIGAEAFRDCCVLPEIEIPAGIHVLRRSTFAGCSTLSRVTLPKSIEIIEDGAFRDCESLSRLNLSEALIAIGSSTAASSMDGGAFAGCSLKSVVIPPHVEIIGTNAFRDCRSLEHVELPQGLCQIGDAAFSGCRSLRDMEIPDSVKTLGRGIFRGVQYPETIVLPRSLERARLSACLTYDGIYDGCSVRNGIMTDCDRELESVNVPRGVTTIRAGAFNRLADELTIKQRSVHVDLPDSLEVFERSRLAAPDQISFAFPERYLQKTHALPMPFTQDLIAGGHIDVTVQDAASLYLFQDARLSQFASGLLGKRSDSGARAMFRALRQHRSPRAILRAAAFAERQRDQIGTRTLKALYRLALAAGMGAAALRFARLLETEPGRGVEYFCAASHSIEEIDGILIRAGLDPRHPALFKVRLRNKEAFAGPHVVKCLLAAYLRGVPETSKGDLPKLRIDLEAREIERDLDMLSLQAVLEDLFPPKDLLSNIEWLPAYCRFASEVQIAAYDRTLRSVYDETNPIHRLACVSMVLNDSREAMCRCAEYAVGGPYHTLLDYWAHLRGVESPVVDGTVRVHLEADGTKTYNFPERAIQVRLEDDLLLHTYDAKTGMSLPRIRDWCLSARNIEALAADLEDMEDRLEDFLAGARDVIRHCYITGRSLSTAVFERLFLQDPVTARLAEGIIWTQEAGASFIASADGLADADGNRFDLNRKSGVQVAHLMEMKPEERKRWLELQKKQKMTSFLDQLGERVHTNLLPSDYYNGMSITVDDKREFERIFDCRSGRHRMTVGEGSSTFDISCRAVSSSETWAPDSELRLGSFHCSQLDRAANLALNLLDDMTIRGRIRRDDTTVLSVIEENGCSQAEILSYLKAAMQADARNVTAALLELRNQNTDFHDDLSLD